MKKIYLVILILLFQQSVSSAQTHFGLFAGLSTPNDQINNIYNSSKYQIGDNLLDYFRESATVGYHIGAKIRFSMSDNFEFTGSAALHKFPESEIEVRNPENDTLLAVLTTSQNIIPLTVGLNFYIINSTIGIYGTGELSYNYISYTVDADYQGVPIPLERSTPDNRVGFGIGAGINFDIKLLILNLETKYNIANLIGTEKGEQQKNYLTVSLGVFF
jgi:hypothetical protein